MNKTTTSTYAGFVHTQFTLLGNAWEWEHMVNVCLTWEDS